MINFGSFKFEDPAVQALVKKYEQMKEGGMHVFFESDELTLLAEYYASIQDGEAADEIIEYGLQLYPENLDLIVYHCQSLMAKGKVGEAEEIVSRLPDSSDYMVRLLKAEICMNDGRSEEGEKIIRSLYDEDPDISVMLDIAQIYLNIQSLDKASVWLEKAYAEAPDDPDVLDMLSTFYFRTGNTEKEIEIYNKILDNDSYNVYAWQQLARCYIRLEQPEKALEAIGFAGAIDDTDQQTLELEGLSHIMMNNIDEAISRLESVKEGTKNRNYVHTLLLNCYTLKSDLGKILKYSDLLLDDPDTEDERKSHIYYQRAAAYLEANMVSECREEIKQGLSYNNYDPHLYQLVGELYLRKNKKEEAKEAFMKAIGFADNPSEMIDAITQVYLNYDCWADADDMLLELEKVIDVKVNAYSIAFSYYLMEYSDMMIKYLVMAAVYTPYIFLNEDKNTYRIVEPKFVEISREVFRKVKNHEIDVDDYLK